MIHRFLSVDFLSGGGRAANDSDQECGEASGRPFSLEPAIILVERSGRREGGRTVPCPWDGKVGLETIVDSQR